MQHKHLEPNQRITEQLVDKTGNQKNFETNENEKSKGQLCLR